MLGDWCNFDDRESSITLTLGDYRNFDGIVCCNFDVWESVVTLVLEDYRSFNVVVCCDFDVGESVVAVMLQLVVTFTFRTVVILMFGSLL